MKTRTKSPEKEGGKGKAEPGGAPLPESFKRLKLATVPDVRAAMRRFTRLTAQGKMGESMLRSLTYALSALINSYRIQAGEGGNGIKRFAWDVITVEEGSLGLLLEFYRSYWWMQHLSTTPQLPGECHHSWLQRLKAIHGDPLSKLEITRTSHEVDAGHKPEIKCEAPTGAETETKGEPR